MEEDTGLGFVFYSDIVTFLRIDPEDFEISVLRCNDKKNPACPLSFKELFFKIGKDQDVIKSLISYI